jgi:HEAT repeat protein
MIGPYRKPPRLLIACCLAALVGGCASGWNSKKEAAAPTDVLSPAEQIEGLRKMGEAAAKKSPQEQEESSKMLAAAIQKESDPLLRSEIIHTLGYFATATATAVCRAGLKDPDANVRISACEALGRKKGPVAVQGLAETLKSDLDKDVRLAAARALGETKDPAAREALGVALDDPDPAMQYRAVVSLRLVTGQNFGNDVARWKAYAKGEPPPPAKPVSIANRLFPWM